MLCDKILLFFVTAFCLPRIYFYFVFVSNQITIKKQNICIAFDRLRTGLIFILGNLIYFFADYNGKVSSFYPIGMTDSSEYSSVMQSIKRNIRHKVAGPFLKLHSFHSYVRVECNEFLRNDLQNEPGSFAGAIRFSIRKILRYFRLIFERRFGMNRYFCIRKK